MKEFFRHFRFSMFGAALLCVLLGIALLIWPDVSQTVFCYAFGSMLVLSGLLQIAVYLVGKQKGLLSKIMFAGGLISMVAGVWVLLSPGKVLQLTVIVVGVVLIYHGVMDVKYSSDLKRCESRCWAVALLCGLITCAIGVLLLVNPFESMDILFIVVAIGFLFDGASDLFTVVVVADGERRYALAARKVDAIEGKGEVVELPAEEAHAIE